MISFGFRSLVLRSHEHYNSGQYLLDEVSSKLRLCCFLPWLIQGLYESDATIQATNWLTDGRAPTIIRHALTALSMHSHSISQVKGYPGNDSVPPIFRLIDMKHHSVMLPLGVVYVGFGHEICFGAEIGIIAKYLILQNFRLYGILNTNIISCTLICT